MILPMFCTIFQALFVPVTSYHIWIFFLLHPGHISPLVLWPHEDVSALEGGDVRNLMSFPACMRFLTVVVVFSHTAFALDNARPARDSFFTFNLLFSSLSQASVSVFSIKIHLV